MNLSNNTASFPAFLRGGGEMGELTRSNNWKDTVLGDPLQWPQSLRTSLSILLHSKFPMFLFWGPELICFYNDAYRPSLGNDGKHPHILGMRGEEAWPEIWHTIKPYIDQVISGGDAIWHQNQLIPIYRNGRLEEVYWTFSYSPVINETGEVGGVFVTCNETTEQVNYLKKVHEREATFRALVDQAPVGITIFRGPEFIVEMANAKYAELIGKSEKDIIGKPFFDSVPEVREAVSPLLTNVLVTGESYYGIEFEVTLHRYGRKEKTYFNFVYQALREEDGSISGIIVVANEVTLQVEAKLALQESEHKFSNIVMQSPIAMTIWRTRDYIVEMANTELLNNIWRRELHEVKGKKALELFPELLEQKYPDLLKKVFDTGITHRENEAYALVEGKDGMKEFYLDFEYSPLLDHEGIVDGIMITVYDVTEKVQIRKKIVDAEERLRIAVDASRLGTFELTIPTGEVRYSDRYLEILGFETGHRPSHTEIKERIHPDDIEKRNLETKKAIETGTLDYEMRIIPAPNSIGWIRAQGKVFYDDQQRPVRISGGIIDITSRKVSEAAIQESEERFRHLSNSVPQHVWTADASGNLNFFNQSVFDFTGLSNDDINRDGWLQIVHPDDRKRNIQTWMESVRSGEPFLFEHRFKRHDGQYRWQLSRAVPQRDAMGIIQMWVGTSTDIDEIKKNEQQKDDFIKMASHELKTPVTSIKGYVQLLQKIYSGEENSRLNNYLTTIDNQVSKLTNLITDLLDVTKIETGTLELKKQEFAIDQLVKTIAEDLQHVYPTHLLQVNDTGTFYVHADRDRISQVLINYITNAVKYSSSADKIIITINANQQDVIIGVQDFGIGISTDDHTKIFERFYRVQEKEQLTYPGFGIGLFIVQEIINRHSGKTWVTSEKGKGSVFYFSLPLYSN